MRVLLFLFIKAESEIAAQRLQWVFGDWGDCCASVECWAACFVTIGCVHRGWTFVFPDGERRRRWAIRGLCCVGNGSKFLYGRKALSCGEKANFLFGMGVRARIRLWPVLFGRTFAFVRLENSDVLRGGRS